MKTGDRVFGIVVTTVGIALLLVVFLIAYQMLTHPVPGLKEALAPTSTTPGGAANTMGSVGNAVIDFLLKLAVLFVMTLIGSHISARGVQLYHGAAHASAVVKEPSISRAVDRVEERPSEPEGSAEPTGRQ